MIKRVMTISIVLLVLSPVAIVLGEADRERFQIADWHHNLELTNASGAGLTKSAADTFCMLSHRLQDVGEDPGIGAGNSLRGDFQDDLGLPHWDDWYGVDLTVEPMHWHVATYNASNLERGLGGTNHAWWVGEDFPSCGGGDPDGGYGNNYDDNLDYYGEVLSDALPTSVRLQFNLNYDNEPGYDYLYVQVGTALGMVNQQTFNGSGTVFGGIVNHTFQPADYVAHPSTGNPSFHLRFFFQSDGAWSDADCMYPTAGGAQVDSIVVSGDNGTVMTVETVNDGDPDFWQISPAASVGDFAYVWPLLTEIDDCCHNVTPQIAFIDDGRVVPGTGGTPCITWCYAPGGWIVNTRGGLAGPWNYLNNQVWSPPLEWPAGDYEGGFIEYTVFRHFGLGSRWAGMFYVWNVRSSDDGGESWSHWGGRSFVYYGGPDCIRLHHVISDLLYPDRTHVQLALGIYDLGWIWTSDDASPAPYFDDVRFCAFTFEGPAISTREIQIAQDSFPENGALNCNNPCGMNVRFDEAWDVSLQAEQFCYYGDSVTFDIVPVRSGTALAGMPELCYKLSPNPLFDGCRTSGLPNRGCVFGDSARANGVGYVVTDRFEFDLPDSHFFFPGDMIHYYVRAADTGGKSTTLPGDTCGFSHFPGIGDPNYVTLEYPSSYTVRALPSIQDTVLCSHPEQLWWNDFANRGLEPEWMHAWWQCGYGEREDYDIFYTNGPSSGVGNGLGGKATAAQLLGYNLIAYSSGDLDQLTITDVNYDDDCGDDIGVLETWFDTGDRCLFLTGNDLVFDLDTRSPATSAWEDKYIQVDFMDTAHDDLLGQWNPTVEPVPYPPANPVFACATRWMVDAYCNPISRYIDLVVPDGDGNPGLVAEFLDLDCATGQYPHAAAVYNFEPAGIPNGKVVYLPYDLGWIADDTRCGGNEGACQARSSVRAEVLRDVLHLCDMLSSGPLIGVPERDRFYVRSYPNPFNPRTKVEYSLPIRGRLQIAVYNVRGELVRTLIDEVVEAGPGILVWDGTDESGAAVSSGIYFCKTVARGKTGIHKMALIK